MEGVPKHADAITERKRERTTKARPVGGTGCGMAAGVGSAGRAGVAVLARAGRSVFPGLRLLGAEVFRAVAFLTLCACTVLRRRRSAKVRD
eukprot:8687109-Alexandrium_andersonii.AAC.1